MSAREWIDRADRLSPWGEATVVVAGLGTSGFAAVDGLLALGAGRIVVLDDADSPANREKADLLGRLDVEVRLGAGSTAALPGGVDLVVTSPGWRPTSALLRQAVERGVPVWCEVELAWRMMQPDRVVPWLGVTGTNGKTTTTTMLASMLNAAGLKADAVGNVGRPIVEALLDDVDYDVLAVELSSFQLHWSASLALHSAAVLNLQPDHLEWYAHTSDPFAAYAADKATIYRGVTHACVYNADDPATEAMVEDADVADGARAIGFRYGVPAPSMLGVVDELLVDRAFIEQRRDSAMPLAELTDVRPFAPHNVENALAAAALARSFGVPPQAVAQGLRDLEIGDHRIQTVAEADGVRYVDDSKATNPHAAASSMRAFDSIVWIAGGQAKGTAFDDLVTRYGPKLKGAVLLGVDRGVIADALARHAPGVPVIVLDSRETRTMAEAVRAAAGMAAPGDTVLMAPGCASLDMWPGYAARGRDFTDAARSLTDHR
ncbi:MAG: UDP-N-acetylmuramoyl-L-alanine--D-glutamate ligase [Nigerium sp.]|nr:UDP-N-acetylmuramoyl-L-alanine--D-glutamate ligase [Nigerium sp.]